MGKINIHCDCGIAHEVDRDKDAPETAVSMGCNWCPTCENDTEYYNEWYNYDDGGENYGDDPNQLLMFSITDEILKNDKTEVVNK